MPADQAPALVRQAVTSVNPRLLPSFVPSGLTATVSASAGGYTVTYADDLYWSCSLNLRRLVPEQPMRQHPGLALDHLPGEEIPALWANHQPDSLDPWRSGMERLMKRSLAIGLLRFWWSAR